EADPEGTAAGVIRDGVDAVPTPGVVDVAARFDLGALERDEGDVAAGGELAKAQGAGLAVKDAVAAGSVVATDGAGTDEDGAFDARLPGVSASRCGGDRHDGEESVVVEELGEVHTAERTVVDDSERARELGSETADRVECDGGFAADVGH